MRIGILNATEPEAKAFDPFLDSDTPREYGPLSFKRGMIGRHSCLIAVSGIGKVNAAAAATLLITKFDCQLLVISGVAADMSSYESFRTNVVKCTFQYDYGVVTEDGLVRTRPGDLSQGVADPNFYPDLLFYKAARQFLEMPGVVSMQMATGDGFQAGGPVPKGEWMDMETAAVAQVAEAFGIPWLAIKTGTDRGEEAALDQFWENVGRAAEKSAGLVAMVIKANLGPLKS